MILDDATGNWLAGLIDGEGCFRIQTNRSRRGGQTTYAPSFSLKLRDDDEPILREIAGLGAGVLVRDGARSPGSRPCIVWLIQSRTDCAALVALLDEYPLRTRKARDYAVWRRAVRWWLTTPRGNRWHGPKDYAPIRRMQAELSEARRYREEVVPCVADSHR